MKGKSDFTGRVVNLTLFFLRFRNLRILVFSFLNSALEACRQSDFKLSKSKHYLPIPESCIFTMALSLDQISEDIFHPVKKKEGLLNVYFVCCVSSSKALINILPNFGILLRGTKTLLSPHYRSQSVY